MAFSDELCLSLAARSRHARFEMQASEALQMKSLSLSRFSDYLYVPLWWLVNDS